MGHNRIGTIGHDRMDSAGHDVKEAIYGGGPCLLLKSPVPGNIGELLGREGLNAIRLSESAGWKGGDLAFLRDIPEGLLQGLEIYSAGTLDLSPVMAHPRLRFLGLRCAGAVPLDLSCFGDLEGLGVFWSSGLHGLAACTRLKMLNISGYPSEDLAFVEGMKGLLKLSVSSGKLRSTRGIGSLGSLESLDISCCRNLESLEGLGACRALRRVEIEGCRRIGRVDEIGSLAGLVELLLVDCGKLDSIRCLEACRNLETLIFSGDTNVLDGDIGFLKALPALKNARFQGRRHYALGPADFS